MEENVEIKIDPRNYRIHGDENKRLIHKSLVECGAGRSVLADRDNVLIAGNGVYEEAQKLGLKVRIVESDGTELIVIKRKDLSTEDEKGNCWPWQTIILPIPLVSTSLQLLKISASIC